MENKRKTKDEREANRIHCRETRERRKERERLLKEEVEILGLYKTVVEDGPDLFSCHRAEFDAPFSFVCGGYHQQLHLNPRDLLGLPLATIVDPQDAHILQTALFRVIPDKDGTVNGSGVGGDGALIHLRVVSGGHRCEASMTIVAGSQGIIVVTRLYENKSLV